VKRTEALEVEKMQLDSKAQVLIQKLQHLITNNKGKHSDLYAFS